jgi:hypothetical protein
MRTIYVTAALLVGLTGCSSEDGDGPGPVPGADRQYGETAMLAGGEVSTWAELDDQGAIAQLGLTVAATAIDAADRNEEVYPAVPASVQGSTPFDHVGFGYQGQGHGPPGVYDLPHFDIHFYLVDDATRQAVDCVDEPMPAADRVPEPYFIPGTGLEPDGTCVPGMGIHALNPLSPELAQVEPEPFTHTLIYGYHGGELAFVEPMVTQEWLGARESFSYDIQRPGGIAADQLWPNRLTGSYDANAEAYHLVFDGFGPRP